MALEAALRNSVDDDFDSVNDVEELNLDELAEIDKFSNEDKKFIERFRTLTHLSLNGLGLNSLENFPSIQTLMFVHLHNFIA